MTIAWVLRATKFLIVMLSS